MKRLFNILLVLFSVALLYYLLLPNYEFPAPPPGSLQSDEPADSETPLRRAYFTDYSREETMAWYKNQIGWGIRLNYPPEDAQTLIRDQTRSTFLEEIVRPFRESLYVNGFEPTNDKDAIIIGGRHFRQKIIIRFVPSSVFVRVGVFAGIILAMTVLFGAWKQSLGDIIQLWKKKN